MILLKENDIINIMHGAALLAAGGGGSFDDGMVLLNAFKKNNPNKPIEVPLIDINEMDSNYYAAVVAGMGAPIAGAGKDFTPCAIDSFQEIQRLAALEGKNVQYMMPVEMGAFNTFVPFLISLMTGLPVLDADACGRAVPGLDTILSHINGGDTSPLVMADDQGNLVHIRCTNPRDAVMAQSLAGPIAQKFQSNAGIAGWVMNKMEISSRIPTGTISLALKIGETMNSVHRYSKNGEKTENLFYAMNENGLVDSLAICTHAPVRKFMTEYKDGFDVGSYEIGDGRERYKIYFQNENLILYRLNHDGSQEALLTAPDIITIYNAETGVPLTNEDLFFKSASGELQSLEVALGVVRVDTKWWDNIQSMHEAWQPYFSALDYRDGVLEYDNIVSKVLRVHGVA